MGIAKNILIDRDDKKRHNILLHALPRSYINKEGYKMVATNINTDGEPCAFEPRYRIVDRLFKGKLPEGYVIHHKNGIKTDDRLNNLKRLPQKEHNHLHHQSRLRLCSANAILKPKLMRVRVKPPKLSH